MRLANTGSVELGATERRRQPTVLGAIVKRLERRGDCLKYLDEFRSLFRSLSLDPLCGNHCDAFNSQCKR